MLCWAANLVEAYNKEVRVGLKDRVMVLLRPSEGGGVEDMYKLTKGRSVNFFHVLHLCKTWNFLDKSTFFCENGAKLPHRSHLGLPSSFPGRCLKKCSELHQWSNQLLERRGLAVDEYCKTRSTRITQTRLTFGELVQVTRRQTTKWKQNEKDSFRQRSPTEVPFLQTQMEEGPLIYYPDFLSGSFVNQV